MLENPEKLESDSGSKFDSSCLESDLGSNDPLGGLLELARVQLARLGLRLVQGHGLLPADERRLAKANYDIEQNCH